MYSVLTFLLKAALLSQIQFPTGGDLTGAIVKGNGLIEREGVTKKISEIEVKPSGKDSLEIRVKSNRTESFKAKYKLVGDSGYRLELTEYEGKKVKGRGNLRQDEEGAYTGLDIRSIYNSLPLRVDFGVE